MPPLTYEDAYNATDPNLSEDERKASANRILEGVRANQIYWDSRSELEALRAQAEGHGVVVRGADSEEGSPTVVGTGTGNQEAIDSTATEVPATELGSGESANVAGSSAATPTPTPDNSVEAVSKLRAQLRNAGIDPEA